jgi:hypothetical protein
MIGTTFLAGLVKQFGAVRDATLLSSSHDSTEKVK